MKLVEKKSWRTSGPEGKDKTDYTSEVYLLSLMLHTKFLQGI